MKTEDTGEIKQGQGVEDWDDNKKMNGRVRKKKRKNKILCKDEIKYGHVMEDLGKISGKCEHDKTIRGKRCPPFTAAPP